MSKLPRFPSCTSCKYEEAWKLSPDTEENKKCISCIAFKNYVSKEEGLTIDLATQDFKSLLKQYRKQVLLEVVDNLHKNYGYDYSDAKRIVFNEDN